MSKKGGICMKPEHMAKSPDVDGMCPYCGKERLVFKGEDPGLDDLMETQTQVTVALQNIRNELKAALDDMNSSVTRAIGSLENLTAYRDPMTDYYGQYIGQALKEAGLFTAAAQAMTDVATR